MLEDVVEVQPAAHGDRTEQLAVLEGNIKKLLGQTEQDPGRGRRGCPPLAGSVTRPTPQPAFHLMAEATDACPPPRPRPPRMHALDPCLQAPALASSVTTASALASTSLQLLTPKQHQPIPPPFSQRGAWAAVGLVGGEDRHGCHLCPLAGELLVVDAAPAASSTPFLTGHRS